MDIQSIKLANTQPADIKTVEDAEGVISAIKTEALSSKTRNISLLALGLIAAAVVIGILTGGLGAIIAGAVAIGIFTVAGHAIAEKADSVAAGKIKPVNARISEIKPAPQTKLELSAELKSIESRMEACKSPSRFRKLLSKKNALFAKIKLLGEDASGVSGVGQAVAAKKDQEAHFGMVRGTSEQMSGVFVDPTITGTEYTLSKPRISAEKRLELLAPYIELRAAKRLQKIFRQKKAVATSAATLIQKMSRAKLAKTQVEVLKTEHADKPLTKLDKVVRQKQTDAMKAAYIEEKRSLARLIQARMDHTEKMPKIASEISLLLERKAEEKAAATLLQSKVRMMQVSTDYKNLLWAGDFIRDTFRAKVAKKAEAFVMPALTGNDTPGKIGEIVDMSAMMNVFDADMDDENSIDGASIDGDFDDDVLDGDGLVTMELFTPISVN